MIIAASPGWHAYYTSPGSKVPRRREVIAWCENRGALVVHEATGQLVPAADTDGMGVDAKLHGVRIMHSGGRGVNALNEIVQEMTPDELRSVRFISLATSDD